MKFKLFISFVWITSIACLCSCHNVGDKFPGKVDTKEAVTILHHPIKSDSLSLDSFKLISFKPEYPGMMPETNKVYDTIFTDSVYLAPADSPEVHQYSRTFKFRGKADIRVELKNYPIKDDILQCKSLYVPNEKKAYKFLLKGFNQMFEFTVYSGDSLLFQKKN